MPDLPTGELTRTARAWMVLAICAGVVAMHAVELLVLVTTGSAASEVVVVATALPWLTGAAFSVRSLLRGTGTGAAAGSAALAVGALGVSLDGALNAVPGQATLCAVGLTGIVLGLVMAGTRRSVLVTSPFVAAGQFAMLLTAHGTAPRGWFVAVATTTVTVGALGVFVWLQEQRRSALREVVAAARVDPLTGLLNRRGMAEGFARVRASASAGQRTAVIALDLDHFKAVNDAHGHDVGDRALSAVAELLRAQARAGDLVVRLGGEELAWIGTWDDAASVTAAAERLRRAVGAAAMPRDLRLTVSAGAAFSTDATQAAPHGEALSRLLVRADDALYRAKAEGRDRVVLAAAEDATGADAHHGRAPAPQQRDGGSTSSGAGAAAMGQRA